ncbi:MAG: formylglycine-generating enzyme family protein [Gammaproteobacteria bacterium]|nr:formylglycine-generating enzyme family protein [Gammaproteobacteria bacterium]
MLRRPDPAFAVACLALGASLAGADAADDGPAAAMNAPAGAGEVVIVVPRPQAVPGGTFRDALRSGGEGPAMVVVPAGRFRMGCLSNDVLCAHDEEPVHEVTIPVPFALSAHEVTFEDYDRFTGTRRVDDQGWGRGPRPVVDVSWDDAREYVEWLSLQTGAEYRLPTEAEWEYAARAGTTTVYSWGNGVGANRANCGGCGSEWGGKQTAPVGSFASNAFGLHDMHGNVWEWVADCWNESYGGAPSDGSAWLAGDCAKRVVRGGSWFNVPSYARAASRAWSTVGNRLGSMGFRVARTLAPRSRSGISGPRPSVRKP